MFKEVDNPSAASKSVWEGPVKISPRRAGGPSRSEFEFPGVMRWGVLR